MPGASSLLPGSLSHFVALPDDVWLIILSLCAHDPALFSSDVEYTAVAAMRQPMPPFLAQFARGFVFLNRRFNGMAVPILWRYVVVCTPASLQQVATLAASLGQHTLRFELRLQEQYHLPSILDVLSHMPNLVVFLHRNFSSRLSPIRRTNPVHVIDALCQYSPLLRRIQLDAESEYPSIEQVRVLLNAKPHLETLRVCGFASDDSTVFPSWDGQAPLRSHRPLCALSLGASYWVMQTDHRERALASFLLMLIASDALPALKTVHLMETCSTTVSFLQKYGTQLLSLLSLPPNTHSFRSWEFDCPHLTDLCPHLNNACWYIKDWVGLDSDHPIPLSHPTLRHAEIVIHKVETAVPEGYEDSMRSILGCLLRGTYPSLQTVTFAAKGGLTPDYSHSPWFSQMAEAFATKITGTSGPQRLEQSVGVRLYAL